MTVTAEQSVGERTRAVLRNAIALVSSTLASAVLGMLFWIVANRLYSQEQIGQTTATISAVALVSGLSTLGIRSFLVRFVHTAGLATKWMLGAAYCIAFCVSLIVSVVYYFSGLGGGYLAPGPIGLLSFVLQTGFMAVFSLQDSILTAMRRTVWIPAVNILINLGKVVLLPVALTGFALTPVLFAWNAPIGLAVLVVNAIIMLWFVPRHARQTMSVQSLPSPRLALSFISGSFAGGLLSTLTMNAPPVIVSSVLGTSKTALFYMPWLITSIVLTVSWNVAVSFLVEVNADRAKTRQHLRHVLRLLALVHIGGGLTLLVAAPLVLAVFGGARVAGGATVLRVLGLALACQVIPPLFSVVSTLKNRVWWKFWVAAVRVCILLGGSYLGMRHFGLEAAAFAYLAAVVFESSCVLPATVRGLQELVKAGDEAVLVAASAEARTADVPVDLVPSAAASSMNDMTLILDALVDWERLGRMETVMMVRVGDADEQRLHDDGTIPMTRQGDHSRLPAPNVTTVQIGAPVRDDEDLSAIT